MKLKHVAQIYRDDEFLVEIGILLVGGNYNDMDCHKGMYRLELHREFGGSYNLVHDGFYETFADAIKAYMDHSGGIY